jgi:integrase
MCVPLNLSRLIDSISEQIKQPFRLDPAGQAHYRRSATRPPFAGRAALVGINGHQELLGHADVQTTMIYTHVLNRGGKGVHSPLDE